MQDNIFDMNPRTVVSSSWFRRAQVTPASTSIAVLILQYRTRFGNDTRISCIPNGTYIYKEYPQYHRFSLNTHAISGVISKASGWMPMGQMLTLIKRPLYSIRLGYDSRPRILRDEMGNKYEKQVAHRVRACTT